MMATLVPIVTLVRVVLLRNASMAMPVIRSPLVVSGIVAVLLEPVYATMVISPLLVIKVNWACTAPGKPATNNNSSSQAVLGCIISPEYLQNKLMVVVLTP